LTIKKTTPDIPKAYEPAAHETGIYKMWSDGGFFAPNTGSDKSPFVIVMPPPNVTGALHMGHALTTALEDLMTRWHRMLGEPTLFLPGADHAGIATQVVVERELAKEGTTRHDLGREEFLKRVWDWVDRYGDRINVQLERLGASCDWSRRGFTLDPGPTRAVRQTFFDLHAKGLLYRGERIINWCPSCATALSELEVKYSEQDGALYHIRYVMEDGSGDLVIATTRPETLLGDTSVAVNPDDDRFSAFIGKSVVLPILGRIIPVIGDEAVETDFGTGALKVTPGHDPTDFEIGARHGLETINIMNPDGSLNENAGPFAGQDRFAARKAVIERLEHDGLLVETEPYRHSVGHCDRSGDVVEPLVSLQWFVKTDALAGPAMKAVRDGDIKIVPERFEKVYFNWMENIRDWCVSRQLWWGHRIPVWYCGDCEEVIVAVDDPAACPKCRSENLQQDPDVLDTWFSSGLWTHSTLGWPEETDDFARFYPGTVMETGYDILFFWVARMIMLGMFNNGGQVPFSTVYLHGLILDPEGKKMSKTKGNVTDPLDLADAYGTDALRFALTTGNAPGNDMRLNEQKLEWARNFANKVWNSARFVMMNMDRHGDALEDWSQRPSPPHREDRWILSRLSRVAGDVNAHMENFQFGDAQKTLHDFTWNEYCDWYIEMAKVRIRSGDLTPLPVLAYVLERIVRLLHPFMPFVTEAVWQQLTSRLPQDVRERLGGDVRALIVASYPTAQDGTVDERAEREIEAVVELVRAVRNLRAEFRVQSGKRIPATVSAPNAGDVMSEEAAAIGALAMIEPLSFESDTGADDSASLVLEHSTVTVPLAGVVDLGAEVKRLTEELASLEQGAKRLEGRLSDEQFLSKAPDEVVEKERERLSSLKERRERVSDILSRLAD
jgi:valyl-tRNA synthetase